MDPCGTPCIMSNTFPSITTVLADSYESTQLDRYCEISRGMNLFMISFHDAVLIAFFVCSVTSAVYVLLFYLILLITSPTIIEADLPFLKPFSLFDKRCFKASFFSILLLITYSYNFPITFMKEIGLNFCLLQC